MKRKWLSVTILFFAFFITIVSSKEVKSSERKNYDISEGDIVIKKSGDYNLVGTSSKNKLRINSGAKVNLWIRDLTIAARGYSDDEYIAPIYVENGAELNLIVSGNNTITNTWLGHAIEVVSGAKLSISKNSTGTLTANGSVFGSGIGGNGYVSIAGGSILANGGSYGAGIGNSQEPNSMSLTISGGMVTARSGYTPMEAGTDEITYRAKQYENLTVLDVCTASFVINGGDIYVTSTFKQPENPSGEVLYQYLINCNEGTVKSITMNGKDYGFNQFSSKGYLSLWGKISSDIAILYENGKKTILSEAYPGILSDDIGNGMTLDLSVSSAEFFEKGFIYQNHLYRTNPWDTLDIKIIGSTNKNRIIVHKGDYTFHLDHVKVDFTEQEQNFFSIESYGNVTLNFSGVNQITTKKGNHAFFLGYEASLSFVADQEEDVINLYNTNGYGSIFTATGTINQYGGTITTKSMEAGYGMVVGDRGSYHLYGGRYQGSSETAQSIYGHCQMKVYVHGGELIADTIGYVDEGNEEITDDSTFISTGGNVKISQRMIFGKVVIYGGQITAHLLGAGSGTQLYQYAGDIVTGKFITYYYDYPPVNYIVNGTVNKESAVNVKNLYGGSFKETNDVTVDELKKIRIGRG